MKKPNLVVDAVIIKDKKVLLIKRKYPAFKGWWALPGGFVDYGETVEKAVVREAKEETGLNVQIKRLLGVYSDPKRDPRGHNISVVFLCDVKSGKINNKTNETLDCRFFSQKELNKIKIAFDHRKIIRDALKNLKHK